jgi:glycosyltransferase involved in cell wall biosynthesis
VGRLSAEKGIDVLARAVPLLGGTVPVRVAGTGPEEGLLQHLAGLRMLGPVSPARIYEEMAAATALVMPSVWYENFPRALVEAYASELPVIASRLGAMVSLVEEGRTGLLFEPGNAADLAAKMAWAAAHPQEMRRMGLAARRHYEGHLTGDANHAQLLAIYREAID